MRRWGRKAIAGGRRWRCVMMLAALVGLGLPGAGTGERMAAAEDAPPTPADEPVPVRKACIDGTEPGWRALGPDDFWNVNCSEDTWKWDGNVLRCTGKPIGVLASKKVYRNFELVVQWRHRRYGGNSGVFVWAPTDVLKRLKPGQLPKGIEVQILDHGYKELYEKRSGKKADWFTTNGDVFPTQGAKMTPFPPVSPNGSRSFPRKELSRGVGEWNHYYVRCINGEVRLWVNGEEVSGGTGCDPREGHLCLESEGAPIEFRGLRIRELP